MIRTIVVSLLCFPTVVLGQVALDGTGGALRVLDKVTAEVHDLDLTIGESVRVGHLTVTLEECRVPRLNPTGDAYAQVMINYQDITDPIFRGWLIASAPALHAMDHPRYDVWALRCSTS